MDQSASGKVEYRVDFELAVGSGIDPINEVVEFEIEPNPAHSPTEADPQPCWRVFIPPGCFQFGINGYELVDPFGCGVTVQLVNAAVTDITEFVTAMEGSVRIRDKVIGVAKLEFETEQICPATSRFTG